MTLKLARRTLLALAPALLILGLAGSTVLAQTDEKLPDGASILDNYIKVSGGKAAYEKLTNRVAKGALEMPAQGLKFNITLYTAKPDKFYSEMESDALGKMLRGVDGDLAWESSDMNGPQIKEGDEAILMKRGAVFNADLHWRKQFKKAECVAIESIDDKPCYKVVMTPTEGEPETRWYDKATGLPVKSSMMLKLEMGEIPIENYPLDYKEVDGITIAHKTRIVIMGMDRFMTLENVEHNVELSKDRFEPPEEIRTLIKQQKAGKPEPATP